ncbi:MAG: peptide-methionine (S)-S-oxide reductase MsrA [Myxococcales bacterium]|nr:peptide-methionine (S)-S-oxide reductase MsrA [Myxococcales bacterium]
MRTRHLLLGLAALLTSACSPADETSKTPNSSASKSGAAKSDEAPAPAHAPADPQAVADAIAAGGVAYFAGGCFWGVEYYMEQLDGVLEVQSGYMGGHVENPTYQDVLGHESGHLESVQVVFDPKVIGYEAVAKRFFEIHDPTQANGQGPDIGPQYISAVFVADDEQRKIVAGLIAKLKDRGYDVVTQIRTVEGRFWPAEDYHQDYYQHKGSTPYCHSRVDRFGDG